MNFMLHVRNTRLEVLELKKDNSRTNLGSASDVKDEME